MSVYKDTKSNTWKVYYRFTDWQGKVHQSTKRGFPTKREALAWEREQLSANDVLLGVPGVLFQPVLHIGCVGVDKALKGHIQIGFYLVKLFPLPSKRLSFRRKATLC